MMSTWLASCDKFRGIQFTFLPQSFWTILEHSSGIKDLMIVSKFLTNKVQDSVVYFWLTSNNTFGYLIYSGLVSMQEHSSGLQRPIGTSIVPVISWTWKKVRSAGVLVTNGRQHVLFQYLTNLRASWNNHWGIKALTIALEDGVIVFRFTAWM